MNNMLKHPLYKQYTDNNELKINHRKIQLLVDDLTSLTKKRCSQKIIQDGQTIEQRFR